MGKGTIQFIKDAEAGGFQLPRMSLDDPFFPVAELLLNPDVWKAVGKTRNWKSDLVYCTTSLDEVSQEDWSAILRWHHFIDGLAGGKTIDQALQAISK
jgi:hypothetical protein